MATGAPISATASLRERRCLFARLLAELILWMNNQGWEVAFDEGRIKTPRRVRIGAAMQTADDAEHIRNSFHYHGLAQDLLLYADLRGTGTKDYISDGDAEPWKRTAAKWESMHPLCTSGRRWRDANHVSLGEGSKTEPLP